MCPQRWRTEQDRLDLVGSRPRGLEECPHRSTWIVVRVGPDICFQYCHECVQGQWWSEEDGPIDRDRAGLERF
jgi:hypothetical protein